jgi:hypothetical protein
MLSKNPLESVNAPATITGTLLHRFDLPDRV